MAARKPLVLAILDGVGLGAGGEGDAVALAHTPTLDALLAGESCSLKAHGLAVGLPSDADMGNSEVGHNAIGAGRVVRQGAGLVSDALESGEAFATDLWRGLCGANTLHLLGLLSDGNVHSHERHLHTLIRRAKSDGVSRLRVHILTDGRDVGGRTALTYVERLEALLDDLRGDSFDCAIASGGGRMLITMDRYEADWPMVERGWDCHVRGKAVPFSSAAAAIEAAYASDPDLNDQWVPPFVIVDDNAAPLGPIESGDSVLLFNFRGDRALEISRAFEGRDPGFTPAEPPPEVLFAGMMQYDGDASIPHRYLVAPPTIDDTVGQRLAEARLRTFAVSETQKFGHVTFFFNGNRSGYIDPQLERYVEIPSLSGPTDKAPEMRAAEIARVAAKAIRSGEWDHVRLNLANGDMVGHTGEIAATIKGVEAVDRALEEVRLATAEAGGVLLVTADHGNADEMVQWDSRAGAYKRSSDGDPVVSTAHSRNPVPFALFDEHRRWRLLDVPGAGLASVGSTILVALGLEVPRGWSPPLLERR